MALKEILMTFYLLTGTPEIRNAPLQSIPYSEPKKQQKEEYRITEGILSEELYDFSQVQKQLAKSPMTD